MRNDRRPVTPMFTRLIAALAVNRVSLPERCSVDERSDLAVTPQPVGRRRSASV